MSITKNMAGVIAPEMVGRLSNIPKHYGVRHADLTWLTRLLNEDMDDLFEYTKSTLGASGDDFWKWAKTRPTRSGTSYAKRVDFWAAKSSTFCAVPFCDAQGNIVFPWFIQRDIVYASDLFQTKHRTYDITELMPLFPRCVNKFAEDYSSETKSKIERTFKRVIEVTEALDKLREDWLKGTAKVVPVQAELEDIEDLDNEPVRFEGHNGESPFGEHFISRGTVTGRYRSDVAHESAKPRPMDIGAKQSNINKEENDTMTKESNVKSNLVETHKEALKAVGYLNGGRASNKLTKEAVRPMLNAMFKPTFMQRIAMKLFKLNNPVEEALKHPASDFFCAELANLIVEVRGVENEHVREVAKAGIVYSGMELSKLVPFEEAMDKVVEHLEAGAGKVVEKMKGKK